MTTEEAQQRLCAMQDDIAKQGWNSALWRGADGAWHFIASTNPDHVRASMTDQCAPAAQTRLVLAEQQPEPEPRDWQVVWAQGLLFAAGYDVTWEVMEDNLTEVEAKGPRLQYWLSGLEDAVGVIIKARRRPPTLE